MRPSYYNMFGETWNLIANDKLIDLPYRTRQHATKLNELMFIQVLLHAFRRLPLVHQM
ncbi:hypothetical protein THF5H11_40297 [Vibrio jasicida]|nr:hypothetical protein THF5H11_40297 [Vibrio jasicida]CAH1607976.1 hypothetical protein THF5G08_50189 [Vibrio jasicida]